MRRRFRRLSLKAGSVRAETVTETSAELADMSVNGIGINTPMRLMPGSRCLVTVGNNGSLMILKGTAIWERFSGWSISPKGLAAPLFSAGIRLDDQHSGIMTKACGGSLDKTMAVRVQAADSNILLSFAEAHKVLNISYGGLLVESRNPMEVGIENSTRIFLPDCPEPLRCQVRVTSCKAVKQEAEKKYRIGCEFIDLDRDQTDRITTFISLHSAI